MRRKGITCEGGIDSGKVSTYLEGVFPGEALLAMAARERLHRQVDTLMPLEIVIPVEALGALVALEWAVIGRSGSRMTVHVLEARCVAGMESGYHAGHANQLHLPTRTMHVRHDGTREAVGATVATIRPRVGRSLIDGGE